MWGYIDLLERKRKLRWIGKCVEHTWEVACVVRGAYQGLGDQERSGMLFERVEGFDIPVVTDAMGASRETLAIGLGIEPDGINGHLIDGLLH